MLYVKMEHLMFPIFQRIQRKSLNTIHIFSKQTKQVDFKCGFETKSSKKKNEKKIRNNKVLFYFQDREPLFVVFTEK